MYRPAADHGHHRASGDRPFHRGDVAVPLLSVVPGIDEGPAAEPDAVAAWATLTSRELEVATLVSHGATNQQAAKRLHLSVHTVSAHLRHTFVKLGVCSRVELTRIAVVAQLHAGPAGAAAPHPAPGPAAVPAPAPAGRQART